MNLLYFQERITQGDTSSGVAVCCLWTPQVLLRNTLSGYALMGNLYSSDGVDFLVRNILANPFIRVIILCGKDLSGSGEALLSFWNEGTR